MSLFKQKPWLAVVAGLVLGFVVFFPLNRFKHLLVKQVAQIAGADLELGRLSIGTGLGLGFFKGSILAVKANRARVTLRSGKSFQCDELTLSPNFLPLLVGQLKLGIGCYIGDKSRVIASVKVSPLWSPAELSADLDFMSFNLDILSKSLDLSGLSGTLNGEGKLNSLSLIQPQGIPPLSWKLKGSDIGLPSLSSDFISLPSLQLGELESTGSIEGGKILVDSLSFGGAKSPMDGNMTVNFGLDEFGFPISGEWKGKLRTDPDFESRELVGKINLDLVFGKVKETGYREFVKKVTGNVASLMLPPSN